jgi:hypothetical protein
MEPVKRTIEEAFDNEGKMTKRITTEEYQAQQQINIACAVECASSDIMRAMTNAVRRSPVRAF